MADPPDVPDNRPTHGAGAAALTLAGIAAAFGVASCCGLPFLFATAGLGTAWLGSFAVLAAPHRVVLLIAAAACLAGGAVLHWRQWRTVPCASRAICARPVIRGVTLIGLFVGLVLLYIGYAYA